METAKMRQDYGWGWNEECKEPELGDVLASKRTKCIYTVIAIDGQRLTTHCSWMGVDDVNSSIVFIEPLPDVGHFQDFNLIGNILGAVKNTKDHCKEYQKKDTNQYIC